MRTAIVICVIAASAFIGPSVRATLSYPDGLDQEQPNQNQVYAPGGPTWIAQTFTAASAGYLHGIEIGNTAGFTWQPDSPPIVQIHEGLPSQPGVTTPLGQVTLSTSLLSTGWTPIDFLDLNIFIPIVKDTVYSIMLASPSGTASVGATYFGANPPYDDYLGGELWTYTYDDEDNLRWLDDVSIYDMQFRTYVVPVPLPAGVWLGIFAVTVAGWHLKRQMA